MTYIRFTSHPSLVLITLTLILFSSCGSDEDEVSVDSEIEVNLDVDLILNLVNDNRSAGATCGENVKEAVADLVWSDELAKAALDHSNDMQQNNYFNHDSQDGRTFSERATAAGFEGSPVGENIANGYQSENAVMTGWMESFGHCENIMSSRATHIGVAKSDDGFYWTMVLGQE